MRHLQHIVVIDNESIDECLHTYLLHMLHVRRSGYDPQGFRMQKAFVEKMIDLPRNDPAQWHNVAPGAYEHRLVGRHMDPKKRTFEVVSLSRVLGPAMVVRDPAGVQDQDDSLVHRYYVSAHHTEAASYHGGPSDEAYRTFKGISRSAR